MGFSLFQNYPNPLDPSTSIGFELPKSSHVSPTVYDVLGREISVLVNDWMESGVHDVKTEYFMASKPPKIALLLLLLLFAFRDSQAQWVRASGLDRQLILTISASGPLLYAGGLGAIPPPQDTSYIGGIFRSSDGGRNWEPCHFGLGYAFSVYDITPTDSGVLAATSGGFYLSQDSGKSWQDSNVGFPGYTSPVTGTLHKDVDGLLTVGHRVLAAVDYGGIYRSDDGGKSWTPANSGVPSFYPVFSLGLCGSRVFAGLGANLSYVSADTGSSWQLPPLGTAWPSGATCFANSRGYFFAGCQSSGIYRSSDRGATWEHANVGLTSPYVADIATREGSTFACTHIGGVFLSTDEGGTWAAVNTGLPTGELDINALLLTADEVLIGNAEGVWHRPLADLVTSLPKAEDALMQRFRLEQNYPNPFNPNSEIRYQISDFRIVRLSVYDLLGREVAVLVNEKKAPGMYQVKFDGSNLASGVYFYRMLAGDFVQTRRLVILK